MKSHLTIVHVTNNYTPYEGGVVSYIKAYHAEFKKRGHHVFIVTLDFVPGFFEEHVISVFCPFRFIYKFGPIAVPWRATKELQIIFARLKPNIVHIHHPFVLGYAAIKACKKLGIPTVFTHHTQYDACIHYVPGPSFLLEPLALRRVFNFCQHVTMIIAPSTFIKERLLHQGVTCSIMVLPSPILPMYSENMPIFAYKPTCPTKKLLYVGRFTPEKNIHLLLQLIKKLSHKNFFLTIAGFGYLEHELIRYAYQDLKLLPNQVVFVKKPEKTVLCTLYKEADLFVFASRTETNPIVFAESMAAGTPVVSLRGDWHSEHLVDAANGFWANNLEDMCSHILKIGQDQELFRKLQQGAWQTGQYFCAKHLALQLEKLYHEATSLKQKMFYRT